MVWASKRDLHFNLVGVRRKVIRPYTFSDGSHVPTGNWVCIPQRAIQRDPALYERSTEFDGFRFIQDNSKAKAFIDIDSSFPFWGMGRSAW